MRKITTLTSLVLAALLILSACGNGAAPTPPAPPARHEASVTNETPNKPEAQNEIPSPPVELETPDAYELCTYCGDHYIHEPLRQPTPPLNIHEILAPWQGLGADFPHEEHEATIAEFVRDFEHVHTVTYIQFETNWRSTIILWSDIPLRDFSFVSLDVAGHDWDEDVQLVINTREVLLTIDELLPTDAVVLNVAFAHYLLPHGAIIFTDEQGIQRRMFITESMRGGCFPAYNLGISHEFAAY